MTLQWTVVAVFLYFEIFIVILLLLPWIRPSMWNRIFKSRALRMLEGYAHVYSWAGVGVLLLLFADAIREVRKYSAADVQLETAIHTAHSDAIVHMRLFRAQRNLYISGFALFLWLIIRRLVTLISREAQLQAGAEAAMRQAQNASDTARHLMDDKEGKGELAALTKELEAERAELRKARLDRDAMKEQAHNLQDEYDRLSDINKQLERKLASGGDKKDD